MPSLTSRERTLIAALVVAYGLIGFVLLDPEVPYTGDIGVKFVQAHALVANRFASLDIPYPGEFLDPSREFLPMREPFIMHAAGETQAIFPSAFAVVQGVAVMAAGFHGLVLLSVLAGGVMLYSGARLVPAGVRLWALLAMGVAGPMWFYASSSWEHAPGVALGAAAFAASFTWQSRYAPLASGLLIGAGALVRDEVLLLLPGLLVATWLARRSLKPLVVAAIAAAVPLVASAVLDVVWFDRPAFAHVRHAVHFLDAAAAAAVPTLEHMTLAQRYETVVEYWLVGHGTWIAPMTAALLLALLVRWRFRSSVGLFVWCLAIVGFAAGDLYEVVTAPKWLAGLHRVAPYLVFALFPAAGVARAGHLRTAVWWTCAAYVGIAFAAVNTAGGKGLGPRLLLPLFPLLAVAAIVTIDGYRRSADRFERWTGWTGVLLVLMAMGIHVFGTLPAYSARNADDSRLLQAVAARPERIVVVDDQFAAQLLLPLYRRKIILLADSPELGARLGQMLERHRLHQAIMVARRGGGIELPPLTQRHSELQGRMAIQQWQR